MMPYKDWIPKILSIAFDASNAIVDIYERNAYQVQKKLDNSPVTEADVRSHHIIQKGLFALDSTIPLLSEEGKVVSYDIRSTWSRYWLVDPLDGTQEFIKGTGEFVINIALIENHVPVLGVVIIPTYQQAYWAIRGEGAYAQVGLKTPVRIYTNNVIHRPLKVVASRRLNQNITPNWIALMARLGKSELIYRGSAWKLCLVATGEMDLYPQLGATKEWDTAAGQCILEAAGGQLIDFQANALQYNLKSSLENPPFCAIANSELVAMCCG